MLYDSRHYGFGLALIESIFVTHPQRHTGAGIKLIRQSEEKAKELGCPALLVTAPLSSRLSKILLPLGYNLTNLIFLKKLPHV
jgi:hypothetical protein